MKKIILVTGARRGLGLAIVERLATDGYHVIAAARSSSDGLDLLCESGNVAFEKFDLSDVAEIHQWVRYLTQKYGRFYGLINNAAIGSDGVLSTMHESQISE